jgi:hypothetical protein
MTPEGLLTELIDLAAAAGLRVRSIRPGGRSDSEPPATSGVCLLRGETWVMLSVAEPVEAQIDVIAGALRENCADFLEERYLPPAVRSRITPREFEKR